MNGPRTTRSGAPPALANAFFRFAAETALAHAEALKHPEQDPCAEPGRTFGVPASTHPTSAPSRSVNVIVLDAHRKAETA